MKKFVYIGILFVCLVGGVAVGWLRQRGPATADVIIEDPAAVTADASGAVGAPPTDAMGVVPAVAPLGEIPAAVDGAAAVAAAPGTEVALAPPPVSAPLPVSEPPADSGRVFGGGGSAAPVAAEPPARRASASGAVSSAPPPPPSFDDNPSSFVEETFTPPPTKAKKAIAASAPPPPPPPEPTFDEPAAPAPSLDSIGSDSTFAAEPPPPPPAPVAMAAPLAAAGEIVFPSSTKSPSIVRVSQRQNGDRSVIHVETVGKPRYRMLKLRNPNRIWLDLEETDMPGGSPSPIPGATSMVKELGGRFISNPDGSVPISRVMITLNDVTGDGKMPNVTVEEVRGGVDVVIGGSSSF